MKTKVADFIIDYLYNLGINEIFLVYGSANAQLVDSISLHPHMKYVCTMHEQGGGFAAEGYAKVSRKFGVALATSGPGGTNLVTSAANCFYDSVPCLFLTGQIHSDFLRPTEEIRQIGFQEAAMVDIFKPVTKYAVMVTKPEDVKYELEKALYLMKEGRPGPVLLDLPLNIQKCVIETDDLVGFNHDVQLTYNQSTLIKQIDRYIEDLIRSKRPTILVGNGVKLANAEKDLLELAKVLKIPMFPTWNAVDIVCDNSPYFGGRVGTYGGKGRNFGIQNTDLLLGRGTRLSGRITGGNIKSFAREAKKYIVDVDVPAVQQKLQQVPFDECLLCDAKLFINLLKTRLRQKRVDFSPKKLPDFSGWLDQVIEWKNKYDPVTPNLYKNEDFVHPYVFTRILSEEMAKDDIILADCGGNIVIFNHAFETKTGQQHITNNGNSPMGFSMAASMGAKLAAPNRRVVAIIGDGGMCMNLQELQTLVNYNVDVKIIIVNNHIYGITQAFQQVNFEGRCEACGPKGYIPPDFYKVAQAFGVKTIETTGSNIHDCRYIIKYFLEAPGPIILNYHCEGYNTYEPKVIGWNTSIEDMYPYLEDDEFNNNMIIEPLKRERFGE